LYDAPAAVFVERCAADRPNLFLATVDSVMLAAVLMPPEVIPAMPIRRLRIKHILSVSLSLMLFAAQGLAQQPATPAPQPSTQLNEITFDDLLAVDAFKMYGEVRNVGQL